MTTGASNLTQSDVSILQRFKNRALEFSTAWKKLLSLSPVPPSLESDYQALKSTGNEIHGTIQWITQAVDSVSSFFGGIYNDVSQKITQFLNGDPEESLGFVSLIPIAAILASMAVMAKFVSDVYIFNRKVEEQHRLERSGMTSQDASKIVANIQGPGLTGNLVKIVKPIGWVIGLFYLAKIVKNFAR